MNEEIEYLWGHASTCGRRPSNEDAHVIYNSQKPKCSFVGIYDGHGGDSASKYSADNLHKIIQQQKQFPSDMKQALEQSFLIVDKNYIKQEGTSDIYSSAGTTACVAVLYDKDINFANVGDSRGIVGANIPDFFDKTYTQLSISHIAKQITIDHKPHLPKEKERIEKYGSCVIQTDDDCSRVAGMLAVSRAIGDAPFKGCGVIANPDVFVVPKSEADFIVVACDGLWDVLSTGEVAFIIHAILAYKQEKKLQIDDSRLQKLYEGVLLFLSSQNLHDEKSRDAESRIGSIVNLGDIDSGSSDVVSHYKDKSERFLPENIAKILAKTAVALGSEDNVSVVVGVRQELLE